MAIVTDLKDPWKKNCRVIIDLIAYGRHSSSFVMSSSHVFESRVVYFTVGRPAPPCSIVRIVPTVHVIRKIPQNVLEHVKHLCNLIKLLAT